MKLILMRGISGSGKSTLAREIASKEESCLIFSTDDFFLVDGEYRFDPKKLGEYHAANVDRTKAAMASKCRCVIIDNTNTQPWEMKPYVKLALEYGYAVEIRQPEPVSFEEILNRQKGRPGKNISFDVVKRMWDRFQPNVTELDILESKSPFE